METRFLSIETDSCIQNKCVNAFEVYRNMFLCCCNKAYFENLQQESIVRYVESKYREEFEAIQRELESFECFIPILVGPRTCIVESIQMLITTGGQFDLELVVLDEETKETYGSVDLAEYICFQNSGTGASELVLRDCESLSHRCITLVRNCVLAIRIAGAIRIDSSIAVVAELGD